MSGFKLLAIRPLEGCDPKLLKNLKEGMLYKFYQNYDYLVDNDGTEERLTIDNYKVFKGKPIIRVDSKESEVDLYSRDGLSINISAIVGKNGSGKSALTELFLKAMFDLSIENDFISKAKLEEQFKVEKEFIEKQIEKSEQAIDRFSKDKKPVSNLFNFIVEHGTKLSEYYKKLNSHNNFIKRLDDLEDSGLFFELICQSKNNRYFIIRKKEGEDKISIDGIEKTDNKFLNKDLFYSIFLNYSIYGLNTNEIGEWIDFLYHKNDGYQTPVVINPQKSLGNIDVNKEERLSKYRLNRRAINDGKVIDLKIDEVLFNLKDKKYNYHFFYDWDKDILWVNNKPEKPSFNFELKDKTNKEFLERISNSNIKDLDEEVINYVTRYILGKLFKTNYSYNLNYFTYDETKTEYKLTGLSTFFKEELHDDPSHKLLKLRQALDLIINKTKFLKSICQGSSEQRWFEFNQLYEKLNENEGEGLDLKTSFTSIFNVDYKFENGSIYSQFSSGQKQMINTLETINYHIRNLVSNKGEYNSINIILDEVELYFHPEYQRVFIDKMIKSIVNENLPSNFSINVLFLTHSPFILSDIPSSNILRLKDGVPKPKSEQTFGANIHDLLANDFFLENTVGEFATNQMNSIIDLYNRTSLIKPNDKRKYLKLEDEFKSNKEKFTFIKNNIGEEVIKRILENHIDFLEEYFKVK